MMLFFDFWEKGGFFVYPLLFCALVSIWVFVQRYFHFWRATIDTREFTSGIRNLVKTNRIAEAVSLCATTPGPVAAILPLCGTVVLTMRGPLTPPQCSLSRGVPPPLWCSPCRGAPPPAWYSPH